MPNPKDIIQPRVTSYLRSAWYARWGVILVVTASFWFIPGVHRGVVEALLPVAAVYNLLLLVGKRFGLSFSSSRWLVLLLDGAFALLLVSYSGGSSSPYLLTLAFMIISGAYWYGAWAGIVIGFLQALALSIQYWVQNQNPVFPKVLVIRMAILIIIGVYVSLLTNSDRSERHMLLTLGTETEKERQRLLALINNMRDAVLVVDNSDNVAIYNQAASALVGRHQELQGKPIAQLLHFEDDRNQPVELKIRRTETPFERKDLRLRAPDNSMLNVAVSVAPYIVDHRSSGHVLIIRDITQEKTIDKEREEFVAVASHELRTPLTIAQGDISLLLGPPYAPQNQESVHMLEGALRSLQQLSHIIKDLTNLSQVESEELVVDLEPLDPEAMLKEFKADYEDQAKAKALSLQVEIDPHLSSATILTSRYVVREILDIFITNAVKFTEKGTVTLRAMNPEDGSQGVTFAISDTGVGISQSDQKKIFEKFFQTENYSTRVHGGTGLGLYIAKQLSARITARLWFDTELGKGSTFYVWVPPYSKDKKDRGKVAAAETKDFFNTV